MCNLAHGLRVVCLTSLLFAAPALAGLVPIQVDGFYDDWQGETALIDDSGDDAGPVDFGRVWVANDQDYLYIRFETGGEVQSDEQQTMRLYLDTDMNAGTGTSYGGIGADLMWEFGWREGDFRGANIRHDDIGLLMGSTVSDTQFEIGLRRDATPNGALFPGATVRFLLRDMDSADVTTVVEYTFAAGSDVPPVLGLGRSNPTDIRVASWNVQGDGLFDGGTAEAAQNRLLDAMDPDVLIITEAWNSTASDVVGIIEQHLPSGAGETWYGVKEDAGNVIVSRFPILQSWEVNPGYRITAVLLELGPDYDTDLLVFGCHWRCCTADDDRQNEADSVIEFMHDARNPGGLITLPANTPMVLGGDLNLVGWRQQLTTLVTGDIQDESTYGPDSAPDWDGADFTYANSRHPEGRGTYTWRNDGSSYYPGVLDFIFYTDSALDLQTHFVLETRTMSSGTLSANGLQEFDTTNASDHAARVADFSMGPDVSPVPDAGHGLRAARLLPNVPNPFNPTTELRFALEDAGQVGLRVFDARGRLVRRFAPEGYTAGTHGVTWDGRDQTGRSMSSGVYYVQMVSTVNGETGREMRSVVLVE